MHYIFSRALLLSTLLLYTYYFLEWLFFITRPSFLRELTLPLSISVLLVPPLPGWLLMVLLLAICQAADRWFKRGCFTPLVPSAGLTILAFMLTDNFTHTLFNFYVGSGDKFSRIGYFAILILLFILAYRRVSGWLDYGHQHPPAKTTRAIILALPAISLAIILFKLPITEAADDNQEKVLTRQGPNILVLSTDGLDADHMSAYGYARDTTPFIRALAKDALLAENSFANSAHTTGSVAALLSGKLPTRTGVIFPPSIYQDKDIFQHFAGLLKKAGYRNLDIGVPYYADSYALNMRNAFDVFISGKQLVPNNATYLPLSLRRRFAPESYFQASVIERVSARVQHALFIRDMIDVYQSVTDNQWYGLSDEKKLAELFRFIRESDGRPFFAHVHLMETHGPVFRISKRTFSIDQRQDDYWMRDFYDDSIINFDAKVEKVVNFLQQVKRYENTILILSSDHGAKWDSAKRVPLIIRFPYGLNSGVILANTQRADIPPTILDYLAIPVPGWMDGDSLISGRLDPGRYLFTASTAETYRGENDYWRVNNYSAPFYSLGKLAVIQCQQWIELDLSSRQIRKETIRNHTDPCQPEKLISEAQAYALIVEHLKNANYDMSGF